MLLFALIISIGFYTSLSPTLIVQAGFTPTPVTPTPTDTQTPTLTPTSTPTATPVSTGSATEEPPLLPQTGGSSFFPLVILALIVLAIASFWWAAINRGQGNYLHK
jgi:LPXTG-motif cell wall-anchored protein